MIRGTVSRIVPRLEESHLLSSPLACIRVSCSAPQGAPWEGAGVGPSDTMTELARLDAHRSSSADSRADAPKDMRADEAVDEAEGAR